MRALQALGAALRGNPLENPANSLTPGQLLSQIGSPDQLWGPDAAVDRDPMRLVTAFRCVQILAATAAGCPLHVRDRATKDAVEVPVLRSYGIGVTPFELWETVFAHLALNGNAFIRKIRNSFGLIVGLQPIDPARVRVEVVDVEVARIGVPWAKRFIIDGRVDAPLSEYEVMHIPGLSTNGIVGLSPIGQMRRTFGLATSAERMAEKLFAQGMLLSGFLTTDQKLDAEKAAILQDRWRAKTAGIDNAYEVAVLDNGAKFERLTMSPADAQFLETRRMSTTDIARLWGLFGWMVNDQEKSTSWGTGMETMFTAFVQLTLRPYLIRAEQRLDREVLDPRVEASEFVIEGLLRGDSAARASFYGSGIVNGWLVPNEARAKENLSPVPWGDEPYLPHNTAAGDSPGADQPSDKPADKPADPASEDDDATDQ